MTDQPPVNIQRLEPPTYTPSSQRDLSAGEMTSLEKIAVLRGKCGRYRRAMRDALDQLRPEEPAFKLLTTALEEKADG